MAATALGEAQKAPDPAWTPAFSDEFDGKELDLSKWTPHDLAGEKAYVAEAAQVSGGALHLAAKPGIVTTFGKFAQTFGRFEVRCKMSPAPGLRVSLRLLPIPSGELPTIEVSYAGGKTTVENRWGTEQTERSYGDVIAGPDLAAGFHTIGIEWEKDHISWSIDGRERLRSVDGVPQQPLYLTLEAEGNGAASFDVDSVRIYRRK